MPFVRIPATRRCQSVCLVFGLGVPSWHTAHGTNFPEKRNNERGRVQATPNRGYGQVGSMQI